LFAADNAIINIHGSGLHFVGNVVMGTLSDGESIDVTSGTAGPNGQINLINDAVTPLPSSLLLLASGLLSLRLLHALRRRRLQSLA